MNHQYDTSSLPLEYEKGRFSFKESIDPRFVHFFELTGPQQEARLTLKDKGREQIIKINKESVSHENKEDFIKQIIGPIQKLRAMLSRFEEIECEAPEIAPYYLISEQYFSFNVNTLFEKLEKPEADLVDLIVENLEEFFGGFEEGDVEELGNAQLDELMFNLFSIVEVGKKDKARLESNLEELMTIYQN